MITLIIAGIAIAVTTVFWTRILEWVDASIFPWFASRVPWLESLIRDAFTVLDKAVVAVQRAAILAWKKIRPLLLKVMIEFERRSGSWIRRTISYLRTSMEENDKVYMKTEEYEIPYEELPAEVREQLLRRGKTSHSVDFTSTRDQEFARLEGLLS